MKKNLDTIILNGILLSGCLWILSVLVRLQFKMNYLDIGVGILIILFSIALFVFGKEFLIKTFNIKKKNKLSTSNFYPLLFGIVLLVIGLLLIQSIWIGRSKSIIKLQNQDYVEISGIIKNKPINHRGRGMYTKFKIDKYSDFFFEFYGLNLNKHLSNKFNQEVKKGDSLKILIKEIDYKKKLERTLPLDFFNKHFKYEKIKIFDLYINDFHYIDLEQTIQKNISGRYDIGFWVSLLVSIVFVPLGLFIVITTIKKLK